jgi:threonylcarbamoyladenosine tRNA methylthiotransferase MtaB
MPHLHLSLQSGDDLILKRMKRRHLRNDAIRICTELKKARPELVFGADLIAGFPTESDEAFENSLRLVDECDLSFLHVFPYSPRNGTPAAKMPQVKADIIKSRAKRLREKGEDVLAKHLENLIGTEQEILVERGGLARTQCFTPVYVSDRFEAGSLARVKIVAHDGKRLTI